MPVQQVLLDQQELVVGGALDLFHLNFIGLDWNLLDSIEFHWIRFVYNGQHIWSDLDQYKRNILTFWNGS